MVPVRADYPIGRARGKAVCKNKNPACAGFLQSKTSSRDFRPEAGLPDIPAALADLFPPASPDSSVSRPVFFLLFFFGQFCPVQGFELKAHGAPPSSELRVTQFLVLLFLAEC